MQITENQKHVLKQAVHSSLSSTSKDVAPLAKVAQKASELGFDYKQTGAKRFLDVILELPRLFTVSSESPTEKFISMEDETSNSKSVENSSTAESKLNQDYKSWFCKRSNTPVRVTNIKTLKVTDTQITYLSGIVSDNLLAENSDLLRNHLLFTFYRLQYEDKILTDGETLFWNTGLFSRSLDPIFALAICTESGIVSQLKFMLDSTPDAQSNINRFGSVPKMANYDEAGDATFNPNLEIRLNSSHIIADHLNRFPTSLRNLVKADTPESEDAANSSCFCESFYRRLVDGAIMETKRLISSQPQTPQKCWYRRTNKICWLIPLKLGLDDKVTSALILEHCLSNGQSYYQGHTIISLRDAYKCARVVQPVISDWLTIVNNN
jgi:hypothetical protein